MKKEKRGGSRPGAGRKPVAAKAINYSVTMKPQLWVKLDAIKGEKTRSAWIADKVRKAR